MANNDQKLENVQLDYAWKWFVYHAEQRVKLFNFMLVVFGALTAALLSAINYGVPYELDLILCIISVILALAFIFLDRRNGYLVWLGENVLKNVETNFLFVGTQDGILRNKDKSDSSCTIWSMIWNGKHRFWMPATAFCFGIVFFVFGLYLNAHPDAFKKKAADCTQITWPIFGNLTPLVNQTPPPNP